MKALIKALKGRDAESIRVVVRAELEVSGFVTVEDGKIKAFVGPDKKEIESQMRDGLVKVQSLIGASRRDVLAGAKKSGLV